MGSWLYAFAMPPEHKSIRVDRGLGAFESGALELGERAAQVRVDEDGHCEPSDVWHELPRRDGWREVNRLLNTGVDLHVELSDSNLLFACTFARYARRPHVSLGWSSRLFAALADAHRVRYLDVICKFSEEIEAAAVVILPDAPGYFEDRIVMSGNDAIVDAVWSANRHIDIYEIWAKGRVDVHGSEVELSKVGIGTFDRYRVIRR